MSTPWDSQLLDTATFYTVTLATTGTQQTKSEVLLYSSIPCNLVRIKYSSTITSDIGQSEKKQEKWRVDVEGIYNGADIGDQVTVDSKNFKITGKLEDTDFSGNVLFIKYFLVEAE